MRQHCLPAACIYSALHMFVQSLMYCSAQGLRLEKMMQRQQACWLMRPWQSMQWQCCGQASKACCWPTVKLQRIKSNCASRWCAAFATCAGGCAAGCTMHHHVCAACRVNCIQPVCMLTLWSVTCWTAEHFHLKAQAHHHSLWQCMWHICMLVMVTVITPETLFDATHFIGMQMSRMDCMHMHAVDAQRIS